MHDLLDVRKTFRNLKVMPTLSFHAPESVARKIRAAAKRRGIPVSRFIKEAAEREAVRSTASFGEMARRVAGIVHSGIGDLSTREGFDD
ncbi:MAG TPA: ribbon-helix-helix protein, CopG family [Opitutaceae bacterium]|nr:ribbon-helix-helix protein, CopG family [Opitutaceae bacterium]